MLCPICKGKAKVKDSRETVYSSVHRKYECAECLIEFQSSEKVDFQSLPKHLKEQYLDEGKFH